MINTSPTQSPNTKSISSPTNKVGAFKRFVAFSIDNVIITIGGLAFIPLSRVIEGLGRLDWFPLFLVCVAYYTIFDGEIFGRRSPGKSLMKIKVVGENGKPISPSASLFRALFVQFPFFNGYIGQFFSESTPLMVGIIYIFFVVVLGAGVTIFTLFNPSKRGLHDLVAKTFVIPAASNLSEIHSPLSLRPIIASVVCALLWAGMLFQALRSMPPTADIIALNDRIKADTNMNGVRAGYRWFELNGKRSWYAVEISAPVTSDQIANDMNEIKNKLYSAGKKVNTNPEVDSVRVIIYSKKFYGLIPFSRSETNMKKLSEI